VDIKEQTERPAYVRFESIPVEDRDASIKNGFYTTKDVEHVIITPAGSKDEVVKKIDDWQANMKTAVRDGRMKPEWEVMYLNAYAAWKRGEEIPATGTPLKGWPLLGPSQLKMCLAANVRTVEDLAAMNGEALHRVGMGGQELKQKAESWLKAVKDTGGVVSENAGLRAKVSHLEGIVAAQTEKIRALELQLKTQAGVGVAA
jgi:alkanesulfonate monooxygenase SsuD/methylene tetrahydromethanopterin reductase-like flavin-dependent oxidoreductase (luciferase family)